TNYPVVTTVRAGTTLPILSLAPNGDWYKVKLDGVAEAWIAAALAKTSGALDGVAKLTTDQLPAAPAAVAAAAAPVALAAAAGAPPPSGGGFFAYGIQAHLWQNSEKGFVAGQVRDIGFTWVKSQLRWEFVETSPGNVNWSEPDQIIEVMSGNGINVLLSIFTAPQWSRPDKPGTGGPPDDFNLYADFVGKVAQRYCGRLGAIEVWNEQNLQREWEGHALDPAQYMDLLRRAYTAIKTNCPSVLV
ncbi:MAG TPA: SH3 domain-containing protein, partial [Caldilineaceae bacterium]|nr:SH3 domain-containing protein [Caldilineaceae bacterium]